MLFVGLYILFYSNVFWKFFQFSNVSCGTLENNSNWRNLTFRVRTIFHPALFECGMNNTLAVGKANYQTIFQRPAGGHMKNGIIPYLYHFPLVVFPLLVTNIHFDFHIYLDIINQWRQFIIAFAVRFPNRVVELIVVIIFQFHTLE